ncbi:citramalyl-CoA lyase, mitochondrial-like isoform X2 [Macrobrachium nipponense]|uniref:citramalyl-CoA lyase, mitochondrial-like isoform X2 n=1 Tax=Macrobrachium nipponense TaxID=159736 RepID=UPI0030C8AF46
MSYLKRSHALLSLSRCAMTPINSRSTRNWSSTAALHAGGDKHYIPRRAVLYVPGSDERKLKKIPSLSADCIVMDCEDGVALSKKEAARSMIHQVLHSQEIDFTGKDCSVRFNSVDSGLCEDDMKEILAAAHLPSTVHLPKVESPQHLEWFAEKLKSVVKVSNISEKVRLIIFTESASSLLDLPAICRRGVELSKDSPFELDGIVFGSDDFCADIGATRTNEAKELSFARQYVVTVAKAFKLQAIDLVYIDYKGDPSRPGSCSSSCIYTKTRKSRMGSWPCPSL